MNYTNFQSFDSAEDANEFATELSNDGIYGQQSQEGSMWVVRWNAR